MLCKVVTFNIWRSVGIFEKYSQFFGFQTLTGICKAFPQARESIQQVFRVPAACSPDFNGFNFKYLIPQSSRAASQHAKVLIYWIRSTYSRHVNTMYYTYRTICLEHVYRGFLYGFWYAKMRKSICARKW